MGMVLNGLLPSASAGVTRRLDPERWAVAEDRTAELIERIQPNAYSERRRLAVCHYVQRLIMNCFSCQVFTFGSVALKTYLPDGDIDVSAFTNSEELKEIWATIVRDALEREEKNENAEFHVKEVQYIQAEVKIIKCLVENIVVGISFNQVGGLCTLCFLEEIDNLISRNHLFKRSIILIKAWCFYESRILGARHGLISTYALETLVLYIFHIFNNSFTGPLEVLYRFLEFFSNFDWEKFCLSLWGPVPISSLPDMTAEPPRMDSGELLLNKSFLETCSSAYGVVPRTQENQGQPFVSEHFNVIDPLRTNNNLGRSVSKGNFIKIRVAFAYGAKRLGKLLECPKEDLIAELNQFFANTWNVDHDTKALFIFRNECGPDPCEAAEFCSSNSGFDENWLEKSDYDGGLCSIFSAEETTPKSLKGNCTSDSGESTDITIGALPMQRKEVKYIGGSSAEVYLARDQIFITFKTFIDIIKDMKPFYKVVLPLILRKKNVTGDVYMVFLSQAARVLVVQLLIYLSYLHSDGWCFNGNFEVTNFLFWNGNAMMHPNIVKVKATGIGCQKDMIKLGVEIERMFKRINFFPEDLGQFPGYINHLVDLLKTFPIYKWDSKNYRLFLSNHPGLLSFNERINKYIGMDLQYDFMDVNMKKIFAAAVGDFGAWEENICEVEPIRDTYWHNPISTTQSRFRSDGISWLAVARNFLSHPNEKKRGGLRKSNVPVGFTKEQGEAALAFYWKDNLAKFLLNVINNFRPPADMDIKLLCGNDLVDPDSRGGKSGGTEVGQLKF